MKERLKKLRKELDITQQEFADRIGIKRNSYANYETGRNTPIDAIILSICREFNVNEEWLRYGKGDMYIEKSREAEIATFAAGVIKDNNPFKKKLVEALAKLSEDEWELLEKFAKKISKEED